MDHHHPKTARFSKEGCCAHSPAFKIAAPKASGSKPGKAQKDVGRLCFTSCLYIFLGAGVNIGGILRGKEARETPTEGRAGPVRTRVFVAGWRSMISRCLTRWEELVLTVIIISSPPAPRPLLEALATSRAHSVLTRDRKYPPHDTLPLAFPGC